MYSACELTTTLVKNINPMQVRTAVAKNRNRILSNFALCSSNIGEYMTCGTIYDFTDDLRFVFKAVASESKGKIENNQFLISTTL